MNEILENEINIEEIIYEVRGVEVMLDSDLARLYHCTNGTKDINKAVNRNISRFPNDFYFELTNEECLRFQFGTLNSKGNLRGQHIKYLPHVFTEQGIAMLASILHTEVAIRTSIRIMRSFVKMRHYINYNKDMLPNRVLLLENKVDDNTKRIDELFDRFSPKEIVKDKLFFEGELYDAYSILLDILNSSKNEIIIIDNYAGKELLDILKDINKKIIIVSKNIDNKLKEKYESQYHNIIFFNNNSFHDRFIIIDRIKLYSCGASFKDLGKKCFAIFKFNDKDYLKTILEILDKV